jgi:hypothetical protein
VLNFYVTPPLPPLPPLYYYQGELKTLIKDTLETQNKKDDRVVAAYIKRKCDEKYGPTWQVLCGEDFKAAFTHDTKHMMFLESGKMNVLVWR